MPLLQAYAVGQIRAVLAHELGHYSHQHTRLGALTYRGMRVIDHTIRGVGPNTPAGVVFSGYAALYALVSLAVMRQMELEADRAAVRAAGRTAAVLALRDLPGVGSAWDTFLAAYAQWNRDRTYDPGELLTWFGWLVHHRRAELDRAEPARDRKPRWDSHPPIGERVALIEREPGASAAFDARPGAVLVADLDTMAAVLRTADFDRTAERVAQEQAERDAERLYHAAAGVGGARRGALGGMLDLLAEGDQIRLRSALPPPNGRVAKPDSATGRGRADRDQLAEPDSAAGGAEPDSGAGGAEPDWAAGRGSAEPDQLAELAFAAAAAAVVAGGEARWRHSWSEPMTLVRDDAPVPLGELVTRACSDAAAVAPLRALLLDLGADEESVVGWAVPGRTMLDIGPVFRTMPGTERSTKVELLLPDEFFLLAYGLSGRRRIGINAFEAGVTAAALAELRLRARIRLEDSPATVVVCDATPIGDRFLDSLLARIAAGRRRPADEWLQILRLDVTDAVARRLELLGRYQRGHYGRQTHPVNYAAYDASRIQRARDGITQALNTAEPDGRDLALGALIWATELAVPVLGRTALASRFWLGRIARHDQLAAAARAVIDLNTPLRS